MRMRITMFLSISVIKISNCQMDKVDLPGGEHCGEKQNLAFYISCILRSCSDYLFTWIWRQLCWLQGLGENIYWNTNTSKKFHVLSVYFSLVLSLSLYICSTWVQATWQLGRSALTLFCSRPMLLYDLVSQRFTTGNVIPFPQHL